MDDLIEGLVSSIVGIALLVVVGAVIGAGWLLYKLGEWILPPLFRWLEEVCAQAEQEFRAWWHEVTWKREVLRAHNEAIREIDTTRAETVALCQEIVAALDRQEALTAGPTTAVRIAVRPAVQPVERYR